MCMLLCVILSLQVSFHHFYVCQFLFFFFNLSSFSSEPCGWQGLGALARYWAGASEVGGPRTGH